MIQALKKAAYAHGYLFIIAAWLYTISFVFTNYWSYSSSPKNVQQTLQKYLEGKENELNKIIADTTLVKSFVNESDDDESKKTLADKKEGVFIFKIKNDTLQEIYWNTNRMSPAPEDIKKTDNNYFVNYENGSFELIHRTISIQNNQYVVVGLIPVRWVYFINNEYLNNGFAGFPEIEKLYKITSDKNGLPVYNSKHQLLFRIEKKPGIFFDQPDVFSIILRVLAIFFLLLFINSLANGLVIDIGFIKAFVFLCSIIFLLRLLTYEFPFPFDYKKLELFYGGIYASSSINPSLGDLLINVILLFWIISFTKFNYDNKIEKSFNLSKLQQRMISIAELCLFTWFSLKVAGIVASLVTDSTLSFDVTNFFGLSGYVFIGFIIMAFLVLSFFYLSHLLLPSPEKTDLSINIQLLIVAAFGLFLLSVNFVESSMKFNIISLLWLLLYMLLLHLRKSDRKIRILNSSFFMVWAIFFTVSITALVFSQNTQKEMLQRYKFAENLAQQTDPSGQDYLKISLINFSENFFSTSFNRFYSFYENRLIKDSLTSEIFSGYLNNYDTRIYTFDSLYKPLYNEDSTSYAALQAAMLVKGKPVKDIEGLYYYQNDVNNFGYLYRKAIQANNKDVGYVFILLNPKQNKSEALYPELFREESKNALDNSNYAYAIYNNKHLINAVNGYSFPDTLTKKFLPKSEYEIRKNNNGYDELWYNAGSNKIISIAKKETWLLQYVTFFAYLFCIFIVLVILLHFGRYFLQARFSVQNLKRIFVFNIRTQIHLTIIFVSLFSFIIIGGVTISFFITRFNSTNRAKLSNSIQIISKEINDYIKNIFLYGNNYSLSDITLDNQLEKKITDISEVQNVDVNFYDTDGNLLTSTQPVIYNNQILSGKMNAVAYDQLHNKKNIQFINKESIGNHFSYTSIYAPLKNNNNQVIAYLNIPYLNSQSELDQEISNFLITLIDLNALIFVLSGAIALIVTNRITSSFSFIGNKMREINVGRLNEEIKWNKNDEIGALINEYNKMVKQLEQGAQALAKSEREEAWREMAKQVAHEIKNPLTPMKLSIQYLQKAINDGHSNVQQLSESVAATLIEQIDHLSKIAGDFSQFAHIGNASPELFDISDVISSLVNLYNAYPKMNIEWQKEQGTYLMMYDKMQINRLFTNLIKNAMEASEEKDLISIFINQFHENKNVIVSIADKGSGVKEKMVNKIFTPNFTTKSSGTGLGLAISHGIVEHANGKIWFETKEGQGSIFYVSLPLIE